MNQQPNNEPTNDSIINTTNSLPTETSAEPVTESPAGPFVEASVPEAIDLPLSDNLALTFEKQEAEWPPPPPAENFDFSAARPQDEIAPSENTHSENTHSEIAPENAEGWEEFPTVSETIQDTNEVVPAPTLVTPVTPEKSNLAARVVTSLIGIPIVAFLVWRAGAGFFNVAVGFLALLGLRELSKALRAAGTPLIGSLAYPALIALLMVQPLTANYPRWGAIIIWLMPFLLMVWLLISGVSRYPSAQRVSLQSLALTLFATLYVGLFVFLILLRSLHLSPLDFLDEGPTVGVALLWLTLVSVWAGDIVAYFAGRKFGRDKLTPLSPGKTWQGAVAGFVATIAVCVPVAVLLHIEWRHGLACGLLIALAAPLGDLAESFWKRELQIKDSGGVLPGHGGILDRCDSLLFSAFAVYIYALIFIL